MYNGYSGHCFQINVDKKADWHKSKADCESQGGYLAVIQGWSDINFIGFRAHVALAYHPDTRLWIGLTDEGSEGTFRWTNSKGLKT